MKPIFMARKSVFALSLRVESRWPAIHTSPDVKSSIPERQFSRVVLPQPEGPMIATSSPVRMSTFRPRRAWTSTPPLSYVFTSLRAMTIRSSTRGAFAGAGTVLGTVTVSEATTFLPEGCPCEEAPVNIGFGKTEPRSKAEGGRQSGDGAQAEGGEPDNESEEDDGLGACRESAEDPGRDDDGLRRQPAEESAEGDEEEDAEGREREGGRLQFHPRQDGGRDERSGDRGGDREGQALDRQARRPREVEDDEKRGRHAEADHRETEHEPAEVGPGRLSRAQEDPEVLPLRGGPVHREDSEEEREGLRDGDRGDFVRPRATEAGRHDHEDGEQADEHDAPVPPDPDQMEARHEPGVAAAVRPQADAG